MALTNTILDFIVVIFIGELVHRNVRSIQLVFHILSSIKPRYIYTFGLLQSVER